MTDIIILRCSLGVRQLLDKYLFPPSLRGLMVPNSFLQFASNFLLPMHLLFSVLYLLWIPSWNPLRSQDGNFPLACTHISIKTSKLHLKNWELKIFQSLILGLVNNELDLFYDWTLLCVLSWIETFIAESFYRSLEKSWTGFRWLSSIMYPLFLYMCLFIAISSRKQQI